MSQSHDDIKLMEEIDELIEKNELDMQKALSLVKLNVNINEAFIEVRSNLSAIREKFYKINNPTIKLIVADKVFKIFDMIETKLEQIS
jgi:hypothetical protein